MSFAILGSPRGDDAQRAIHKHAVEMACRLVPHIPGPQTFEPATSFLAVSMGERVLGAVILHNWQAKRGCIEITAAAIDPRWASKAVLRTILRYIFAPAPEGLACVRAQMAIPRKGVEPKRARRFCQGIGFRYEGTARLGFGFDDAVCLSMLRADAERWTGKMNYVEFTAVSAAA